MADEESGRARDEHNGEEDPEDDDDVELASQGFGSCPDLGAGGGESSSDDESEALGMRRPWYSAMPYFVAGDIDGFVALFSNNLACMLSGSQMLAAALPKEIIYDKIIPGVGASMLFGCVWYVVQAQLKASKTGRTDLTCLPFGINTPGLFAFNSGIILAVYHAEGESPDAAWTAWKVGVVANFVQGLVEMILAPIGPYISGAVPMVALLGSLASVGLAWLFTNTLQAEATWPAVTFAPFFFFVCAMFADIKVPKMPSTLLPVLLGAALAWATGKAKSSDVSTAMNEIGFHMMTPDLAPFEQFGAVMSYMGIVVPLALTVAIGTIQVRQMAENAGDNYNLQWSMFGDGLSTVIASLFGSPWGMTVYIGHGTFKAMGAKIGYALASGLCTVVVCCSGLAAPILAIFPAQVLNPIIMFIGIAVNIEALEIAPARHWPAFLMALVPGTFDWAHEAAANLAAAVCAKGFIAPNGTHVSAACAVSPHGEAAWELTPPLQGLRALGSGYLLTSIYWASMTIYVIDHRFGKAAFWAFVAALSASCGLVHGSTVFAPWEGPGSSKSMHWDFTLAYVLTGGLFLVIHLLQTAGFVPPKSHHKPLATDQVAVSKSK